MDTCRVCGAECAPGEKRPPQEGGGCVHCNGSPTCSRCGHPRRDHRGTFAQGKPCCTVRVAAEVGLAVGRCGCPGYTTDPTAYGEPVPIADLVELSLRKPGEPAPRAPLELAPARDLFDQPRRLRGLDEDGGVAWRPPR